MGSKRPIRHALQPMDKASNHRLHSNWADQCEPPSVSAGNAILAASCARVIRCQPNAVLSVLVRLRVSPFAAPRLAQTILGALSGLQPGASPIDSGEARADLGCAESRMLILGSRSLMGWGARHAGTAVAGFARAHC